MEALHPCLLPAVNQAVIQSKGAPTAPTTQELEASVDELQQIVAGIPALITQAVQSVKNDLLGGAGPAFDTLRELQERFATDETAATTLAGRVGMIEGQLPALATAQALSDGLAGKANASTVQGLSSRMNTVETTKAAAADLSSLQAVVSGKAAASDVTALQNTVSAHTTDINNRLRKDQADATTFPLGVPAAASMDKAVQKSELAGGIQRPYRVFANVAATPVGAYMRNGQNATIVDSLGLGQVYALLQLRVKTITAPTLASTISLFKNGSTTAFYSQTVLLTNIPAVGKVVDILGLATSLPADITLPATITASASAGTFEIILDGVLK